MNLVSPIDEIRGIMAGKASGVDPGQRQLNGIQTTGRDYRALSTPDYGMTQDDDVAVPMRDGVSLLADVIRPDAPGRRRRASHPRRVVG
jgi:hypothetical protein